MAERKVSKFFLFGSRTWIWVDVTAEKDNNAEEEYQTWLGKNVWIL